LDAKTLKEDFIANDIYLFALPDDRSYTIAVIFQQDSSYEMYDDFVTLKSADLEHAKQLLNIWGLTEGMTATSLELYRNSNYDFIKLNFQSFEDDLVLSGLYYITYSNFQLVLFAAFNYSGQVTHEQDEVLRMVADSADLRIDIKPDAAAEPDEIPEQKQLCRQYIRCPFSFTLSLGRERLAEGIETFDVAYVDKDGYVIRFGCTDYWDAMTDAEKSNRSRRDITNDLMTAEEVQRIYEGFEGMHVTDVRTTSVRPYDISDQADACGGFSAGGSESGDGCLCTVSGRHSYEYLLLSRPLRICYYLQMLLPISRICSKLLRMKWLRRWHRQLRLRQKPPTQTAAMTPMPTPISEEIYL
jgi:hypothetical protein